MPNQRTKLDDIQDNGRNRMERPHINERRINAKNGTKKNARLERIVRIKRDKKSRAQDTTQRRGRPWLILLQPRRNGYYA